MISQLSDSDVWDIMGWWILARIARIPTVAMWPGQVWTHVLRIDLFQAGTRPGKCGGVAREASVRDRVAESRLVPLAALPKEKRRDLRCIMQPEEQYVGAFD